ncbi:HTH domain-containing protein [Saccharibacillus kuerlensis]|uniref:XRE family transcriptional regulator n=1 Tax=Saccharibacillus kuerlensis TaxID=459527 RepID=A0ABQ2L4F8_9BACL|nr:HTH domain-containing protein [Saccharibacillus kuerlensis]GGN99687.1 hypothetical protein GCM10010969_20010 [Saccharibacillus kuerlensis]
MNENRKRIIEIDEEPLPHDTIGSVDLLHRAMDTYKISYESLERLTAIGRDDWEAYLSGDTDLEHIDAGKRSAAFDLIAFLGMGINTPQILPEERLKAIMQGLSESFGFTAETLALQSGVEPSDAERFLAGRKVAAEKRFKLAMGVLFLYFLIYRKPEI